jgi:hypothetical protein
MKFTSIRVHSIYNPLGYCYTPPSLITCREIFKMQYAQKKTTPDILHKIENIEKDVKELKLSILRDLFPSGKKVILLKGILKGVTITEQDIATAEKALSSSVKP